MLPKENDIEIPLLKVLVGLGGQGRPREIYPLVTKEFPDVPSEDFLEQIKYGQNKWTNRIQWVRQKLIGNGEVTSPTRGIWAITKKGEQRVKYFKNVNPTTHTENLEESYQEYEAAIKGRLLSTLNDLSSTQFESFSKKLMAAFGFVDVDVTAVGPDGGIDGYGRIRLGLAIVNAAFQCKRWKGKVGRIEVDKFRGAIQGSYEQGYFFTTSDFTSQAKDASIRKGAVPVILLNGKSIVDLMVEKELGVRSRPMQLFQPIDSDFDNTT